MDIATNSVCVNGSSQCLKSFIGQLNISKKHNTNYELLFSSILDSLIQILSTESPKEVFVFPGSSNSGISLRINKELPKDGYCFCGSIWIERKYQGNESDRKEMTIFKLGASNEKEMELFIDDGYLTYQVLYIKTLGN